MPALYDFHLSVDPETAKALTAPVAEADGYVLNSLPDGNWTATRGNLTRTILLGAFAGKNFHLVFQLQFFAEGTGSVVRLNRDMAGGALKGGAIGASKAADAFQNLSHALGQAFIAQQALVSTTEA
jgi:hypothetical protein